MLYFFGILNLSFLNFEKEFEFSTFLYQTLDHIPSLDLFPLGQCNIFFVKGVALFGRGKTSVLAHGPRALGVHAGVGPTRVGEDTGCRGFFQSVQIIAAVHGFENNPFRRFGEQTAGAFPFGFLVAHHGPFGVKLVGEVGRGCFRSLSQLYGPCALRTETEGPLSQFYGQSVRESAFARLLPLSQF